MQLNPGLLNIVGTNNSSLDSLLHIVVSALYNPDQYQSVVVFKKTRAIAYYSDAIKLPPSV